MIKIEDKERNMFKWKKRSIIENYEDTKLLFQDLDDDEKFHSRFKSRTNLDNSVISNHIMITKLNKSIKEFKSKCINFNRNQPLTG